MYTGTIFNWFDNSGFDVGVAVPDAISRPLFMVVNSFDKGPEKLMEVDATTFNTLFGRMSYDRHGQGAIQAQKIIDAGGRLLIKRVCANDSKLANLVLVACPEKDAEGKVTLSYKITKVEDKATFAEVKKAAKDLYDPEAENKVYPLFVITDNGRGLSNKAIRIIPDYDTSRGLNQMIYRFNVYEGTTLMENANISLDPTYVFNNEYYGLDKNRMNQVTGEVIPEIYDQFVEDMAKVIFKNDDGTDIAEADITDTMIARVRTYDLIFGYTYACGKICALKKDGTVIDPNKEVIGPKVDENGDIVPPSTDDNGDIINADLNTPYGNRFLYVGDNGSYGLSPAKYGNEHNIDNFFTESSSAAEAPDKNLIIDFINDEEITDPDKKAFAQWTVDIARIYYGKETDAVTDIDEIWDVDSHRLFAVADANYHKFIKDAMANFVQFRKDCIFLRDSGIGSYDVKKAIDVYEHYTLDKDLYLNDNIALITTEKFGKFDQQIISNDIRSSLRSKFFADYGSTYEVVDPVTKKNIEVTMLYDVVEDLVNQYLTSGPFTPVAGTYNGFQLSSAITGTLNFTPIITPSTNQKEAIDNVRLNYAIFEDEDLCVVQSNYTSQNKNTQLSFINNVLSIQEVARVVREACPRNRFRFITGSDMSEYASAVSRILEGFSSYFDTLQFQYTQDPLKSIQKIFYASISFSFNNWAQTEIFDLYALANTTTTSVNS